MAVFKKDLYHGKRWSGYIPVPHEDNNYVRYDFSSPQSSVVGKSDTYEDYFVMQDALYGIPRPYIEYSTESDGWSQGVLNNAERTGNNVSLWETGDGQWGDFGGTIWPAEKGTFSLGTFERAAVKVSIPAGHNRITVLVFHDINAGVLYANWNNTNHDDSLLSYDIGAAYGAGSRGVSEVEITITSSEDSARNLLLYTWDGVYISIVGVRAWDTDSTKLPEDGGEIVDFIPIGGDNGSLVEKRTNINGQSTQLGKPGGTSETTWSWKPEGEAVDKWTGGNAHFGTPVGGLDSADYTYRSGEFPNGPVIIVNGVNSFAVWDDTNNPKGTLLNGQTLSISSTGFADYARDGEDITIDPNIEWTYLLTDGSLRVQQNIEFRGNTEISTAYDLMWPFSHPYGDDTLYRDINGDWVSPSVDIPGSNGIDILNDNTLPLIKIVPLSRSNKADVAISTSKFYCGRIRQNEFFGGEKALFSDGDTLSLGGEFIILNYIPIINTGGILILDKPDTFGTGTIINDDTKVETEITNEELNENLTISDKTITNLPAYLLKAGGSVTIATNYPTYNYSQIPKSNFIGKMDENTYAEIRYTVNGKTPTRTSHLYTEPITFDKFNLSGSDNTVLKYKVFYQGKASITKTVRLRII